MEITNWTLKTVHGNTPTIDTTTYNSSPDSIKIYIPGTTRVTSSGYAVSDMIVVSSLKEYNISGFGKTNGISGEPVLYIIETNDVNGYIEHSIVFSTGTVDWSQKTLKFTTIQSTNLLYLVMRLENGYGTFWLDNVTVSETIICNIPTCNFTVI